MKQTPNLLLKLPEPTDFVLVEDLNENFTKIDTEVAKITDEETGVEAKLTKHLADFELHTPYVVSTGTSTLYEVDLGSSVTTLTEGMSFAVKIHVTNGKFPKIKVNGMEEKIIGNNLLYSQVEAGALIKDAIYTLRYNGSVFVLQGGGLLLNNTLTSTSIHEAATANAVKMVNDRLTSRKFIAGGASDANSTSAIGIAIGDISFIKSSQGLAIGTYARIHENSDEASAVGAFTEVTGKYSVALGANTKVLNANEGILGINPNIGTGTHIWKIPGSLTVTGHKNFEIPHPHPTKKHTHIIRHGAVESPTTGDTLYRYSVTATNDGETIEIQLPDYFEYLNTNVDVWVNPDKHFGRAYGEVVGDKLLVTCEKAGTYKALVIGTRNDENVQDWYLKGVEREIGESWTGETYSFEVDEISEVTEFEEVYQ